MMRAREALCEPPSGNPNKEASHDRSQSVADHLRPPRELRRRGFSVADINSVTGFAWQLRSVSAHSAEEACYTKAGTS
jgi:hypothetical protein